MKVEINSRASLDYIRELLDDKTINVIDAEKPTIEVINGDEHDVRRLRRYGVDAVPVD